MRPLIAPLLINGFCLLGLSAPTATADDADDIRDLIPAAAAIPRADLEELLNVNNLDTDKIENRTLTLVLGLGTTPLRDRDARDEFRHLAQRLSPLKLATELGRLAGNRPNSQITMLHADRITDFTCEIDGEQATGEVEFEAPELYAGRVSYVATKEDDDWRISEFRVPAYGMRLQQAADGSWEQSDLEVPE